MTKEEAVSRIENVEDFVIRLAKDFEKRDYEAFDMVIKALKQPTRKKGKWIFVGDNCFKCSKCGEVYTIDQFNHINNYCNNRFPKGCPNCGEKMEEVEE